MKKVSFFSLVLFLSMITSCIPSLHPIFTENDRIVDDGILGTWAMHDEALPILEYTIESNDPEDQAEGEKKMKETIDLEFSPTSTWTFERAANFTAEVKVEGGSGTVSFSPGAASFLKKNAKIVHKELLPYYFLTHKETTFGEIIQSVMIVNLTEIGGEMYMDFYPYTLKDERTRSRFATNYINGHTFAKYQIEDGQIKVFPFNLDYITSLIQEKRIRLKHENLGEDQIILTASTQELRAFIAKYGDDQRLFEEEEFLTHNY